MMPKILRIVAKPLAWQTSFATHLCARCEAWQRREQTQKRHGVDAAFYAAMGWDDHFERAFTEVLACSFSGEEWTSHWEAAFDHIVNLLLSWKRPDPFRCRLHCELLEPELDDLLAIHDDRRNWNKHGLNQRGRGALCSMAGAHDLKCLFEELAA
jgi:hypothetical protein